MWFSKGCNAPALPLRRVPALTELPLLPCRHGRWTRPSGPGPSRVFGLTPADGRPLGRGEIGKPARPPGGIPGVDNPRRNTGRGAGKARCRSSAPPCAGPRTGPWPSADKMCGSLPACRNIEKLHADRCACLTPTVALVPPWRQSARQRRLFRSVGLRFSTDMPVSKIDAHGTPCALPLRHRTGHRLGSRLANPCVGATTMKSWLGIEPATSMDRTVRKTTTVPGFHRGAWSREGPV